MGMPPAPGPHAQQSPNARKMRGAALDKEEIPRTQPRHQKLMCQGCFRLSLTARLVPRGGVLCAKSGQNPTDGRETHGEPCCTTTWIPPPA